VGVSIDATFIEDFIGFKLIGGEDALAAGVQIDGWGLSYNAFTTAGQLFVKTGAGTFAGDPGFVGVPEQDVFVLGPLVDSAGYNRAGFAKAVQFVPYIVVPRRGVRVSHVYRLSVNAETVKSVLALETLVSNRVFDIKYARIMDVDLFGTGPDHFFWKFDALAPARCFPVEASVNVGDYLDDVPPATGGGGGGQPSQGVGDDTGDFQMAMIIDHGDLDPTGGFQQSLLYPAAYTMVTGQSEADAKAAAQANLEAAGMRTWCIAVDDDGGSLFVAYGVGLGRVTNE